MAESADLGWLRHRARFEENLDRVRDLVGLYGREAGAIRGRPSVREADILRAAVIFLHATLEDLLRSLGRERLGVADPDDLKKVPFIDAGGREAKLDMAALADDRGRSVVDVIRRSVDSYQDRRSYSTIASIRVAIKEIGLNGNRLVDPAEDELIAMATRRHHIAHRLDRNEASGRGHHQARSIDKATLLSWIEAVEGLGIGILGALSAAP